MTQLTRRQFAAAALVSSTGPTLGMKPVGAANRAGRPKKLADVGWCWDGQGFCGGIPTSIFGAGAGTRWFGLRRTCFMFHPNTELALECLRNFDEVVCEISKWKVRRCESNRDKCGVAHYLDGAIETKISEARTVNALARSFPNLKAAIDDDLFGIIRRESIRPEAYGRVYSALREGGRNLKLWTVVYSRELAKENWAGFQPFTDVINLCVGKQAQDFAELEKYLDQCAEIFPKKPVNLIYRLTDFNPPEPVPLDAMKRHWADILRFVENGRLAGFSILGGFLIDMYPETARWLRDFIRSN